MQVSRRLLIVVPTLQAGGAERVVSELSRQLLERGWTIAVATFSAPSPLEYEIAATIERIELGWARNSDHAFQSVHDNLRRIVAIRRAVRSFRPDVVLAMLTTTAVLSLVACVGGRCRRVVSERVYPGSVILGKPWPLLRRIFYRYADAVVMQTRAGQRWIEQHCSSATSYVVPNAVTWPPISSGPSIVVEQIVRRERRVLLAVGRIEYQKGFDLLIDAFTSIADAASMWDLVIIGDGTMRSELVARLSNHELGERIHLPGRAGNVSDWYRRADLFVLSSRFEGFPNALLEAMACGRAAVSFDCPTGPSEILRHDIDGEIVPLGAGSTGLAAALERLMLDDARRDACARRAVEVRDRFAAAQICTAWERILLGVTS